MACGEPCFLVHWMPLGRTVELTGIFGQYKVKLKRRCAWTLALTIQPRPTVWHAIAIRSFLATS